MYTHTHAHTHTHTHRCMFSARDSSRLQIDVIVSPSSFYVLFFLRHISFLSQCQMVPGRNGLHQSSLFNTGYSNIGGTVDKAVTWLPVCVAWCLGACICMLVLYEPPSSNPSTFSISLHILCSSITSGNWITTLSS
jgi:hypothetical protein